MYAFGRRCNWTIGCWLPALGFLFWDAYSRSVEPSNWLTFCVALVIGTVLATTGHRASGTAGALVWTAMFGLTVGLQAQRGISRTEMVLVVASAVYAGAFFGLCLPSSLAIGARVSFATVACVGTAVALDLVGNHYLHVDPSAGGTWSACIMDDLRRVLPHLWSWRTPSMVLASWSPLTTGVSSDVARRDDRWQRAPSETLHATDTHGR
jgi:hypothetical protein